MNHFLYLIFLVLPLHSMAATPDKFTVTCKEINQVSFSDATKAKRLIKELYAIANLHKENKRLVPLCLYWESFVYYNQGIDSKYLKSRIEVQLKAYPLESSPLSTPC